MTVGRIILSFDRVRDRTLFIFTVLWVIVGGLILQFVILPYVIPWAHWGHGLITDLDSLGYHVYAVEQADAIRQHGWDAWQLRPEGHFSSGIASVLYVLIYPEPWVMLPVNGVFFAIAVTAVRRMLAV